MTDKSGTTKSLEEPCRCGETHKGHICWLSRMGLLNEVEHLCTTPTVICKDCGVRANQPHNVCFPETIYQKYEFDIEL